MAAARCCWHQHAFHKIPCCPHADTLEYPARPFATESPDGGENTRTLSRDGAVGDHNILGSTKIQNRSQTRDRQQPSRGARAIPPRECGASVSLRTWPGRTESSAYAAALCCSRVALNWSPHVRLPSFTSSRGTLPAIGPTSLGTATEPAALGPQPTEAKSEMSNESRQR